MRKGAVMAKFVMFDIDGTLVDSNEVDAICFVRSIEEEFDIADIDARWETYKHATDSGIFEEIFERAFASKPSGREIRRHIERFSNLLEEHYSQDSAMFAEIGGAGAVLKKLKDHPEWKIGIATGAWRESALFKLRSAGLDVRGIPLVTGSDAKSREEILLGCIEDSKACYGADKFEKIVSVGDAVWDLKTANKLGVGFVAINEPQKFIDFPDCKVLKDFGRQELFMKCLEEAETPLMPGR